MLLLFFGKQVSDCLNWQVLITSIRGSNCDDNHSDDDHSDDDHNRVDDNYQAPTRGRHV